MSSKGKMTGRAVQITGSNTPTEIVKLLDHLDGKIWKNTVIKTKKSHDYIYTTIDAVKVGSDLYFRFRGTRHSNAKRRYYEIPNFRMYTANEVVLDVFKWSADSNPYPLGSHFEDLVREIWMEEGLRQGSVLF